jgi:hypothetical protein
VSDGLALAREGGFVTERVGRLTLTPLGFEALEAGVEDEPPAQALRLFVGALLLRSPPSWVAWWQGSPADLEEVIPRDERIVLGDAGLLPVPKSDDLAGWGWWQALGRVPLAQQAAASRKLIGDAGEQLSVEFERGRLERQGYPELAGEVRWVARESDAYGFDVLSFAGDDVPGLECDERVAIEVKSTALPVRERFPLYLSSHEWEVALALGERSLFHLWAAVSPGPPASSPAAGPLVRRSTQLAGHLPGGAACGESCTWQSARLELAIV